MMLSVTHDSGTSPSAKSVSFQDNAEGPVANIAIADPNTGAGGFTVLGLSVTVNDLTVFSNTTGLIGSSALATDDIVEISGQLTGTNALLATRVEKKSATCLSGGLHIEVKGKVSNVLHTGAGLGSFDISSPGATLHVDANGHMPSGLAANDYVEVGSNACPSANTLTASAVDSSVVEGPDLSELDHPGDGEMEIKGIVTGKTAITGGCSFSVNGQLVTASTALCTKVSDADLVEVHGQISAGLFTASEISNEDGGESVTDHFTGVVTVDTNPTPFQGTIHVGNSPTITVTLDTQFEAEDTQTYNLDTMAASSTCAEVQVNNSNIAVSIHKEDCH
jgi:hypothetical protein